MNLLLIVQLAADCCTILLAVSHTSLTVVNSLQVKVFLDGYFRVSKFCVRVCAGMCSNVQWL